MKLLKTTLADVFILEPTVFKDARGFFLESWNRETFKKTVGIDVEFVQDNHSCSKQGTLRGLHYQLKHPQGKLVRVVTGKVLDVVVDLRKHSPSFGKHITVELSEQNNHQLWVPAGFAHGFTVLSESANFLYKTTNYYNPEDEHCIKWDDQQLNIDWQLNNTVPSLSEKDQQGIAFKDANYFL